MKRNKMMMLALVGMTAGLAVNAEEAQAQNAAAPAQKAQIATETAATRLSVEEQAFVAGLDDQSRKIFSDKFSADQRKSVMIAVKNGADADEAVQKMAAAKDLKEASSVVNAEKENAATSASD
jgi:hypothetical protein